MTGKPDPNATKPMYNPEAYELGCIARKNNQPTAVCEYPEGHLKESWIAGWYDMNQTLDQEQAKDDALREQTAKG